MGIRGLVFGAALLVASVLLAWDAWAAKLFVPSAFTNQIFRYEVGPTGTPTLELTLTDPSLDVAGWIEFSAAGELFAMNRGQVLCGGGGSVSRFLNPQGTPSFNGTITSGGFNSPHGATFRFGELFVINSCGNNVLRFVFDNAGNASFNGAITAGLTDEAARASAVSPWGELFVSQCCAVNEINRYLFDNSGNAIANGVITGGGLSNPHDMVFTRWGELFVANGGNNSISRFTFDATGNASPNGQIVGNGLDVPLTLAISPWGELFVGNTANSTISRFTFDPSFNAIANGTFATPANGLGDLEFLVLEVSIDIKPGSFPNSIDPRSNGVIPVAILTTGTFDATTVDPSTVRFGRTGTEVAAVHAALEDVDGDGDIDLILQFNTQDTGILCGDTSASLTGQTFGGQAIEGSDSIGTVPCK